MGLLMSKEKMGSSSSTGFSSSSTAEQVTQGIDGSGLTAIVTGSSSGVGAETARVLALRGVDVIMADINIAAATQLKQTILNQILTAKLDIMELDLSSIQSVKNFAAHFNSSGRQLNLLINNAGIMGTPYLLSKDKIELQFATNYLGHFVLTNLLLDTMKRTANESNIEGRIINVSSVAHWFIIYPEGIRFDQLNQQSGYDRYKSYGQSKLAVILHANELTRRFKEDEVNNITANSVHPGSVMLTQIGQHNSIMRVLTNNRICIGFAKTFAKYVLKTVEQGAATTCYVALNPQVKGISGEYFADCNLSKASDMARDMQLGMKLWDFTINLIHQNSN